MPRGHYGAKGLERDASDARPSCAGAMPPPAAESREVYCVAPGLCKLAAGGTNQPASGTTGPRTAMQATVSWTGPEGMSFLAETESGHLVAMDGAADGGGRNLAPRPMEMVLLGAGGCTAYDVVLILKRGRHQVSGCSVRLEADRATADPKVFTRIALHFTVRGKRLSREAVERAVQLSHDKYCSATAMLAKTAEIVTRIEVLDDA